MRALYLALLFEVRKPNLSDFSILNPLGENITIPTPQPLALDVLSTYTC